MTTKSIMTSDPYTLRPSDSVADAMQLMYEKHLHSLPVVDETGVFMGLFGLRRLSRLLLPRAVLANIGLEVSDLSFLPDEVVQRGDRWRRVAGRPVEQFLQKKKKQLTCSPETPFPELLALLDESEDATLPVIGDEDEVPKLVGMVSIWDVLEGIIQGRLIRENDNNGAATQGE